MKNSRKIICLFLALLLTFTFAGCSNNPDDSSELSYDVEYVYVPAESKEDSNASGENSSANGSESGKPVDTQSNSSSSGSKPTTQSNNTSSAQSKPTDTQSNNSNSSVSKPTTQSNNTSSAQSKPTDTQSNNSNSSASKPTTQSNNTSSPESKPTDTQSNNSSSAQSKPSNTQSNNSSSNASSGSVSIGSVAAGDTDEIDQGRIKDLKGRTITYVAYWDATDRNSKDGKMMNEVEKLLNCKLVERKMTDYKALYTSILAGSPIADIFSPQEQTGLTLAKKGYLIELDTLSNFDLSAECWDKAAIKENTLNGHVYAISRNPQIRRVLMYNKTMFEKNNWEDLYTLQEKGKLDWKKLTEIMSKAAVVNGDNITRYGLVPIYSIEEFGREMLWANGAKVLTRKGDTTDFDYSLENSKATNALNQLREWVSNKGYLYDSANFSWDSGRQVFYSGKAAMAIIDYNQFNEVSSNADFDIGMCLFPHGPDSNNDLVAFNVSPTCIPKNVKDPEDVALFWDILGEYRNESVLKVREEYYDAMPDKSVKATIEKYLTNTQTGNYVYDYGMHMDIVTDSIKKVAYGETTAAAALSSIKQQINANIQDFWK